MGRSLYTVGHSTHPAERFLALLAAHGIEAVCDVRSVPYSRRNPQFNREPLRDLLAAHGIAYVFLGDELGARTRDDSCYDAEGRVLYERLARTAPFRSGLERLEQESRTRTAALLCAEGQPLACHRSILVCRELRTKPDLALRHILPDGRLEEHADLEARLLSLAGLDQGELFSDRDDALGRAYEHQARKIAFVRFRRASFGGNH